MGFRRASRAILATLALVAGCTSPAASSAPSTPGAAASLASSAGVPADAFADTPLTRALAGIADDGSYSKDTALAVFAATFGSIPGFPAPTEAEDVDDGTLAIRMVATHWAELTDAQRAAIRDWIGVDAAVALPAAFHAGVLTAVNRALVDQAAADIAAHVGHPLGIPIVLVTPTPKEVTDAGPRTLAWSVSTYDASGVVPRDCRISVTPRVAGRPPEAIRYTLLHEIWHCYQGALVTEIANDAAPGWIAEGEAEWVAETITNGVGASPGSRQWWWRYAAFPESSLFGRTYDALGFFAQLGYAGDRPWSLLEPMYAAGDSHKAFELARAGEDAFLDQWGSSFFRDPKPSAQWDMTTGDGILPTSVAKASPEELELADDADELLASKPVATAVANLHTTAFVTHVETIGSGRIGDPAGGGLDEPLDGASLDLCTNDGGDCTCPEGTVGPDQPPRPAPEKLRVAASGTDGSAAQVLLHGIAKDEWCKGSGLNITVEGVIGGQRYSGLIVGYPAPRLTCYPLGNGNAVHWDGAASKTNNQIGGEWDMEFGTWTVGDGPNDRVISIFGAGTPRQYLGGVSGTITQTPTGGSVDATAVNGVDTIHVSGTWTCPGPSPAPSQ